MIRTALVELAGGALLGALILAGRGIGAGGLLRWRPLHAELLLIGWTLQLALGVAWWILPRFRSGPERGGGGGGLTWASFLLLNAGMMTTGVAGSLGGLAAWTAAGRSVELLAAVIFACQAWPRVKPFR